MEKKKPLNSFQYIWAYSLCIYSLIVGNVSWGWNIPMTPLMLYILFLSLLKLASSSSWVPKKTAVLILLFVLHLLLDIFIWNDGQFGRMVASFTFLILIITILLATKEEKMLLLASMTNCFVMMLLISLPAWILYLMGVPLPHSQEIQPNSYHVEVNYGFFLLSVKTISIFPRFQCFFLEPGQFATPCAFLYFLHGANFNRKNILFLIAILLSFSLIAYGLIITAFIANRMFRVQSNRFLKTILSIFIIAGLSFYFSNSENNDDPITTLIVHRLQYDEEKGITGNNRTGSYFDSQYEKLIKSPNCYWGIRRQLNEGEDWTIGSSGYKKVIVRSGLIGLGLVLFIIFLLFYFNRNLATLSFFVILTTAFLVRDLMMSPLWLSIAIVGFYLLNETDAYQYSRQQTSKSV